MSSVHSTPARPEGMLAGIFVGGRSTRMGGRPKGLLRVPSGETLVERWSSIFAALSIPAVLVGQNPAYARLGMEQLEDAAPNIGPLGGLLALLERAKSGFAIAVACDSPTATAYSVNPAGKLANSARSSSDSTIGRNVGCEHRFSRPQRPTHRPKRVFALRRSIPRILQEPPAHFLEIARKTSLTQARSASKGFGCHQILSRNSGAGVKPGTMVPGTHSNRKGRKSSSVATAITSHSHSSGLAPI